MNLRLPLASRRDGEALIPAAGWRGPVDLAGAVPGGAVAGGILRDCQLTVAGGELTLETGAGHGFTLPLVALQFARLPGSRAGVQVTYNDGRGPRAFALLSQAPRFGRGRPAPLTAALPVSDSVPLPVLALSDRQPAACQTGNPVWSGRATMPLDLFGIERAAASVRLTTRSLCWSAPSGQFQLPLTGIEAVDAITLAGRAGTAAIRLDWRGDDGVCRELVLIFDQHAVADRNLRERGALLVSLRAQLGLASGQSRRATPDAAPDRSPRLLPSLPPDDQSTETPGAASVSLSPPTGLALARAAEAESLAMLAALEDHARTGAPLASFAIPTWSLPAAVAGLHQAVALGDITAAAATAREARLTTLRQSVARLAVLVRLLQSEQIPPARFAARREELLAGLNDLLDPAASTADEHAA